MRAEVLTIISKHLRNITTDVPEKSREPAGRAPFITVISVDWFENHARTELPPLFLLSYTKTALFGLGLVNNFTSIRFLRLTLCHLPFKNFKHRG